MLSAYLYLILRACVNDCLELIVVVCLRAAVAALRYSGGGAEFIYCIDLVWSGELRTKTRKLAEATSGCWH